MAVNISFESLTQLIRKRIFHRYLLVVILSTTSIAIGTYQVVSHAAEQVIEPVQACVIARDSELNATSRSILAQCLGWKTDNASTLCGGSYNPIEITPLSDDAIRIKADEVSFYREGRSKLSGNVEVQQTGKVVNAQTAYIYRDAKTNQVTRVELLGKVRYLEAGRLMIAKKATLNPQDKSGKVEDVLYRFNMEKRGAVLPAWGRAVSVERFANTDYFLKKATYTTCAPQDNAWQIVADSIKLDSANARGVARNAKLYVHNWPVLYTPYLSFPTSKERKSGFLMPVVGNSNVGGFDLALPYYFNLAPNYDATLTPHLYSKRGLMLEGQYRYLTPSSFSTLQGRFLGHDRAFKRFIDENRPFVDNRSSHRWAVDLKNSTLITPDIHLGVNFQQVSDDYFLQDFSTNFAILTERQLLRQADLSYTTDHWFFRGMAQSYQTLQPFKDPPILPSYQRLPQLLAHGRYTELPFGADFSLLGQFDNFKWSSSRSFLLPTLSSQPDGARYHLNPVFSLPSRKPWGYFKPEVDLVENYYDLSAGPFLRKDNFNRTIPRYNIDSGLYFDRGTQFLGKNFTQTLEPRLFYLYVPYHNQSQIPVFDSGYMIFNEDQLFRKNRFSGFDRIGDTNQLSYALQSRWISDELGAEKGSLSIGQILYFSKRRVMLCQNGFGNCEDEPLFLGYLSPTSKASPIVTRATYHFNPSWIAAADYAWDPATHGTNNGHINFHYEPEVNKIINAGYSYLVNGDITGVAYRNFTNTPLHQLNFSYSWPFNAKWSTLGGYNYNISKGYEMMSFLGLQYDNCCWAVRFIGGRSFRNLELPPSSRPVYNNNFYVQILLKGLGAVGNSDPSSRIFTFLPGYVDQFHT